MRAQFPELLTTQSQPNLVDDNQSQLKTTGQPKIVDLVDDNLTELTTVDLVDDLSTKVVSQPKNSGQFDNQVNQVNYTDNDNDNVNDNVNITRVSSNEETLETISLSELNRMGASYKNVGGGVIEFSTGKKMKVIYDF